MQKLRLEVFLVILAAPASAIYSRFLDNANLKSIEIRYTTNEITKEMMIILMSFFFPLPNKIFLKIIFTSNEKIPKKIIEMISKRTSLFLMCISSCAITPSNSSSSRVSIVP